MAPVCRASLTARRPSTTNAPSATRRSRRARERTRAMAGLAAEVMTSSEATPLLRGECLLRGIDDGAEAGRVAHRQVGEHLAIDRNSRQ
jgi:hypothetical protein